MKDLLINLNTVWELAVNNPDIFSQEDLYEILEAHLGYRIANGLRDKTHMHSPCYEFIPCEECMYTKFCLLQRAILPIRSAKECQQNLKKFVSNFPLQQI